jgi:hypothetical protein
MSRKSSKKQKQKIYKMKGCSKTRKHYLGGSPDAALAYTGQPIPTVPNPFLAYTGKGGSNGCGLSNTANIPVNTNAANPAYPNTGPLARGDIFLNPINPQRGGGCGCGLPMLSGGGKRRMRKGGCGPLCSVGFMVGGVRHRPNCKCSECKKKVMKGGNAGIPYPNGLVGKPIELGQPGGLPGENGISGDRNYIPYNNYTNDVSRQMVDLGANPPFLGGKKQKGGTLSNFLSQDLINLGRQFQYGLGTAYNALAGYQAPVNPMPWKDQFPNKHVLNTRNIF